MLKNCFVLILAFVTLTTTLSAKEKTSKIQVALLLDTSNSMDGLINQAKAQLWNVVNELATAKKDGKTPKLEIALYEYGKQSLSKESGFVRKISGFTNDLDKISEDLFALKTNGGDEYCGWSINDANNELDWSKSNRDLKIIYIAGNEGFNQGSVDYKKSCSAAVKNGINVNTIFCGDYQQGIKLFWKDGADLADGKYINIDANQQMVHIDAPQDVDIAKLNQALNGTYINFGTEGKKMKARQAAQDFNAGSLSKSVVAQRAATKANKSSYNNAKWDLVDAAEAEPEVILEVVEEELPEEMQEMDDEEKLEYVNEKKEEREKLQKQITQLVKEREEYVAEKRKDSPEGNTLKEAMISSLKEQACEKNYEFEKE